MKLKLQLIIESDSRPNGSGARSDQAGTSLSAARDSWANVVGS